MRVLGIDYGEKRIGLSYGDELGVATPLPALVDAEPETRWRKIGEMIRQRRITDIVVGFPYNMDGSTGFKGKEVEAFGDKLRAEFALPVHYVDERLTSREAESTIPKGKLRSLRATGLVDSRAAAIILQDFLNQRLPPPLIEPGNEP